MGHPNGSLEVSIWNMDWASRKNWRCATNTAGTAHANSLSEHGYELRRKIEASPRKAVPEWCYNDQGSAGLSLIHSSTSETIDMLCWSLGLIFAGAYTDAEEV
jgi:hypothetical protein